MTSLMLLSGCSNNESTNNNSNNEITQTTENKGKVPFRYLELVDKNGEKVDFSKYKGKKLLIKFYASWCDVCNETLPIANDIASKQGEDFVTIAIASPNYNKEVSREEIINRLNEKIPTDNLIMLFDENAAYIQQYRLKGAPHTVVVSSDGNIDTINKGWPESDFIINYMKEKVV